MPAIRALISGEIDKASKESLALNLSKTIAKAMNKPEAYVQSIIEDGATISFGGSVGASAYIVVRGVGGFSPDVNKSLSKLICTALKDSANIDPSRIYINFESFKGSDWGWNCGTF